MNRSFLKWVGGKGRILHALKKLLPPGKRLVEPFTGAASVFLNTEYPKAVLADNNKDLMRTLVQVKENLEDVIGLAKPWFQETPNRAMYDEMRARFNSREGTDIEIAAMFIYLNKHGYNGLCRYNLRGVYNVPFGNYQRPLRFPEEEIRLFSKKAQKATLARQDFLVTLNACGKGDVVYADPPYLPLTPTSSFSQYYNPFRQADHEKLAEALLGARNRGSVVVLSNSSSPQTKEIYTGYEWHEVAVGRSVNSSPTKRGAIIELIGVLK